VVATPGRLCDLMRRKALNFSAVSIAILDEADEMLNMGFQEDLDTILGAMPETVNTWLFSATMPSGVAAISRKYLEKPAEITIGTRNQSATNISHIVYSLQHSHRYVALKRLLDAEKDMFGLIFRRTRREAQELSDALTRDGYPAEALHGDLSQAQRDSVMRRFRNRQMHLLIATDVAARGLDIDDITHVIHYDLPDDLDVYTHRSGRTARAGKSGFSVVFASPSERYRLRSLERTLRITFTAGKVPDGREACKRTLLEMAQKLAATDIHPAAIADYLPPITEALQALTKEELVARFVATELKNYHAKHGTTTDINAPSASSAHASARGTDRPVRGPAGRRQEDGPMHRFQIDIGRNDNANEGAIVRLVCECSDITSSMIGKIVMANTSSFFDVQTPAAEQVRTGVSNAQFDGRPVAIRDAAAGAGDDDSRHHSTRPGQRPPYRQHGGGGGYRDRNSGGGGYRGPQRRDR
jgi:ATP-dependent RNA helicase DeaD